ncbi:unnamed protein product [Protopolystoma xenopodis]|uniref:Uncharacterized protein n=1 Tax=Protopolystoma xenopodis TaxID=117903 RepID=A0A448XCW3_9PLAT|nr:unnamed protein product [Protopolystoma xenopodis]
MRKKRCHGHNVSHSPLSTHTIDRFPTFFLLSDLPLCVFKAFYPASSLSLDGLDSNPVEAALGVQPSTNSQLSRYIHPYRRAVSSDLIFSLAHFFTRQLGRSLDIHAFAEPLMCLLLERIFIHISLIFFRQQSAQMSKAVDIRAASKQMDRRKSWTKVYLLARQIRRNWASIGKAKMDMTGSRMCI